MSVTALPARFSQRIPDSEDNVETSDTAFSARPNPLNCVSPEMTDTSDTELPPLSDSWVSAVSPESAEMSEMSLRLR